MNDPEKKQPVVMIVGMHRSGTSVAGQLLERLGFDFGGNLLEGMDDINNRGFWEDREVVALDEHIFELLHSSWFDFERLPGKWWEEDRIKDLLGVAQTWFSESFDGERPVGIKDPRFCRLLPFWKRVFSHMDMPTQILFVFRHPAEVAASLKQRDSFSLQVGYLLWLTYTIDALYYSRNMDLSLLPYERLVDDPEGSIQGLLKGLFSSIKLPATDIAAVSKTVIDPENRHQRADGVLADGDVQGDVQLLAHELYEQLLDASVDEAKGLADKYRKRLYRLLDHHKEVLRALQAAVKKQVEINQKLSEVGDGHSHALAVIHDKDRQLEENKSFIEQCLAEIGKKDSILANQQHELALHQQRVQEQEGLIRKNAALWDQFEDLQQLSHSREMELADSLAYIEKCEAWISELNVLSEDYQRLLSEQREYIERNEKRIAEQTKLLAENTEYIGRCEARIAEQDQWLAENKEYIGRCESRVRAQDEGLYQRDKILGERLERIEEQEKYIEDLKTRVLGYESDIADLQAGITQQDARIAVARETIEQLQNAIAEKDDAVTALNVACSDHVIQINEKDALLLDANRRIRQLENELQAQSEIRMALEQKLVLHEELVSRRDNELLSLNDRISDAYSKLSENEILLKRSEELLNSKNHEISSVKSLLAERDETIKSMNKAMQSQLSSISVLGRDLEAERRKIAELSADIHARNVRIDTLDAELSESRKIVAERDHQIAELDKIIRLAQQDISEKMVVIGERDATISLLQAEKSRLDNLDGLNRQRLGLQKKQIESVKAHAAALESEIVAMKTLSESLTRDLERYRSWRTVRLLDKFDRRE